MEKKIIVKLVIAGWLLTGCAQQLKVNKIMADVEQQTGVLLANIPVAKKDNSDLVSPRTLQGGDLKLVTSRDWTSGFFPGILWYLYEYSGEEKWKQQARAFTAAIEREKSNAGSHDVGFKVNCSFGNGLRLSPDAHYKEVIIQAARTLCTRFNAVAGVIKSWDGNTDKWSYPVIIDNMMNLELLFNATQITGDSSFYRIAVAHANTTLNNHFRPDNSSYHVLDYDTITGKVIKKITAQGYSNESAWARGQAWGMYGFTMCYRFTKDPRYLLQAEKIAAFILNNPNLPADHIPYWDYNAPQIPNEERDASAAAILASGLYELSAYSSHGKEYTKKAHEILVSLTNHYRSLLVVSSAFFTALPSCEKKDYPKGLDSLANHYYAIFVPNNNTGVTATRSQTALVKFPVQFYSTFIRSYDAVAKYIVFTTGITPPAAVGVDFNVVDKNGATLTPAPDGTYSIVFPQAKQAMDTIYLKMLNNPAAGARKFEIQIQDNRTAEFDVDIFSTAFRRPVTIN